MKEETATPLVDTMAAKNKQRQQTKLRKAVKAGRD